MNNNGLLGFRECSQLQWSPILVQYHFSADLSLHAGGPVAVLFLPPFLREPLTDRPTEAGVNCSLMLIPLK